MLVIPGNLRQLATIPLVDTLPAFWTINRKNTETMNYINHRNRTCQTILGLISKQPLSEEVKKFCNKLSEYDFNSWFEDYNYVFTHTTDPELRTNLHQFTKLLKIFSTKLNKINNKSTNHPNSTTATKSTAKPTPKGKTRPNIPSLGNPTTTRSPPSLRALILTQTTMIDSISIGI